MKKKFSARPTKEEIEEKEKKKQAIFAMKTTKKTFMDCFFILIGVIVASIFLMVAFDILFETSVFGLIFKRDDYNTISAIYQGDFARNGIDTNDDGIYDAYYFEYSYRSKEANSTVTRRVEIQTEKNFETNKGNPTKIFYQTAIELFDADATKTEIKKANIENCPELDSLTTEEAIRNAFKEAGVEFKESYVKHKITYDYRPTYLLADNKENNALFFIEDGHTPIDNKLYIEIENIEEIAIPDVVNGKEIELSQHLMLVSSNVNSKSLGILDFYHDGLGLYGFWAPCTINTIIFIGCVALIILLVTHYVRDYIEVAKGLVRSLRYIKNEVANSVAESIDVNSIKKNVADSVITEQEITKAVLLGNNEPIPEVAQSATVVDKAVVSEPVADEAPKAPKKRGPKPKSDKNKAAMAKVVVDEPVATIPIAKPLSDDELLDKLLTSDDPSAILNLPSPVVVTSNDSDKTNKSSGTTEYKPRSLFDENGDFKG